MCAAAAASVDVACKCTFNARIALDIYRSLSSCWSCYCLYVWENKQDLDIHLLPFFPACVRTIRPWVSGLWTLRCFIYNKPENPVNWSSLKWLGLLFSLRSRVTTHSHFFSRERSLKFIAEVNPAKKEDRGTRATAASAAAAVIFIWPAPRICRRNVILANLSSPTCIQHW